MTRQPEVCHEYKEVYYQIPDEYKPIYNSDGTVDYPCVATSTNTDKEGDVIDLESAIIPETAFVGYNHYKCNGMKVQTGARVLRDTVVRTKDLLLFYIRVSPSDELFFCENNSKQKKSNGKLLTAIQKGWVRGLSIGYRFDRSKTKTVYVGKKRIVYYFDVIIQEISLLDIAPMSYDSFIINKSAMTQSEKNKCIDCLREAGVGSIAYNPDNQFVKITSIDGDTVKGVTFDGTEIDLDESYEPVSYQSEKDKACACQKKSAEDLAAKTSAQTASSENALALSRADVEEMLNTILKPVLARLVEIEAKLESTIDFDDYEADKKANTKAYEDVQAMIKSIQETYQVEKDKAASSIISEDRIKEIAVEAYLAERTRLSNLVTDRNQDLIQNNPHKKIHPKL